MAWEGGGPQAGIRFVDVSPEQRDRLKMWLATHSPELEPDDPPAACKLTDLSLGACYLEMASPFPMGTRVILTMRTAKLESRAEGLVRVMHPEIGMGVEFTRATNQQHEQLEKFIQFLRNNHGVHPDLVVEPEGMNDDEPVSSELPAADEIEDPLLDLFRRSTDFTIESFLNELRKQRNPDSVTAHAAASV